MTKPTLQALMTALCFLFPLPLLQGGPTGEDESAELNAFLRHYLYGKRIDAHWDPKTGEPDLRALNQRIRVLEYFLGSSGTPLSSLRENLHLGLSRGEYALGATLAINDIEQRVFSGEAPPQVYRGRIGSEEAHVALRWLPGGKVTGLYYLASPSGGALEKYWTLKGENPSYGRLFLVETTEGTQTARFTLVKRLSDDRITWEGIHQRTDGRRSEASLYRWRN